MGFGVSIGPRGCRKFLPLAFINHEFEPALPVRKNTLRANS